MCDYRMHETTRICPDRLQIKIVLCLEINLLFVLLFSDCL